MSETEIPRHLGDYELSHLRGQSGDCLSFDARQVSVGRKVNLTLLNPESKHPDSISNFQAMVRVKAGVHQVHIAPVFEVLNTDGFHFFTSQKLSGETLEDFVASKRSLPPSAIFKIIECVSDALIYLEERGIRTHPLEARDIYIQNTAVCTLENTAIAGSRDEADSMRDMCRLANLLQPLIDMTAQGAGRAHTMTRWMLGQERETPMTWHELKELCKRVEGQFTSENIQQVPSRPLANLSTKKVSSLLPVILGGLLLVVLSLAIVYLRSSPTLTEETPSPQIDLGLRIPQEQSPPFLLTAAPVTIGEYAKFLEALNQLSPSDQEALRHPDTPASKLSFEPDSWPDIEQAATENQEWNGRKLDFSSPIVNVDFWDAFAFSKWQGGRVPSEEDWRAALEFCKSEGRSLPRHKWIREWTDTLRRNPSFPMGPKYPRLICPKGSENLFDLVQSRDVRSPDLGFRFAKTISDSDL